MFIKGIVKKGEYYDSVSLMKAAKMLNQIPGIVDSAIVMGTKENKAILKNANLLIDDFSETNDTDLLVVIKAENQKLIDDMISKVDEVLKGLRQKDESDSSISAVSIDNAIKIMSDANIALISVPGKYAAEEAMKALRLGLHVMLFSDNVSIESEIALKKFGKEKGLLVMGPDCGTAIINGIPLAFANVVNRGDIGIVAASGTGLQEVSCLISNQGCGISQAIGTGGRDVKKEVGGIMFIEAIKMLLNDDSTKIILLVSKPPDESVLAKIGKTIKKSTKPIIAVLLGEDKKNIEKYGIIAAETLEEGALKSAALSKGKSLKEIDEALKLREINLSKEAAKIVNKFSKSQKYVRGLFSGGTFCNEAQIILKKFTKEIYSNTATKTSKKLINTSISIKNTIIDFGDDEFTVGKPHPMIDYSVRNEKIICEAIEPDTAVILFDVVLGYGSNMAPLKDILPVIKMVKKYLLKEKKFLPLICSVTGTDNDPQHRSKVVTGLKKAGVTVFESNTAACKFAGYLIQSLNKK